jgi:hypothetical protein
VVSPVVLLYRAVFSGLGDRFVCSDTLFFSNFGVEQLYIMNLIRLAGLAGLVGSAISATPAQWRSQSIYFMLTDRFARTDGSTTASCDSSMGV